MKLTFRGVRGSHPQPEPEMMKYGGHTTCLHVESDAGQDYIFDAGSGIIKLGDELMAKYAGRANAKIFITHDHWDHIQGFPFFVPAYVPGCEVHVYSGDKKLAGKLANQNSGSDTERFTRSQLELAARGDTAVLNKSGERNHTKDVFDGQQNVPAGYFPVPIGAMGSNLVFHDLKERHVVENGLKVSYIQHTAHPGGMFAYKVQENGKTFVFAGDFEHDGAKGESFGENDKKIIEWSRGADALVIDAQYTPEEYQSKQGWGHSEIEWINYLAKEANIKKLFLTHHDPRHTDNKLDEMQEQSSRFAKDIVKSNIPVTFARQGMEVIF